jgi:hypothetical protein
MHMGPGLSMSSDSDEEAEDDEVQPAANGLGDAASSDDDLGDLRDDFSSDSQPGSDGDASGGSGGGSELWSSDEDADTQPAKRAGRLMAAGGDEGSDSDDEDEDDDPLGGAEFSGSDMEASDDEGDDGAALLPSERKAARLDRKRCVLEVCSWTSRNNSLPCGRSAVVPFILSVQWQILAHPHATLLAVALKQSQALRPRDCDRTLQERGGDSCCG